MHSSYCSHVAHEKLKTTTSRRPKQRLFFAFTDSVEILFFTFFSNFQQIYLDLKILQYVYRQHSISILMGKHVFNICSSFNFTNIVRYLIII